MFRRFFGMSAAFVVFATLFTVVDSSVASAAPPATGTVSCNVIGKGHFSPKLTPAGVATTAVKIKFNAASSTAPPGGCTGTATAVNSAGVSGPVTIMGVKIKGSGFLQPTGPGNANACSVFTSSDTIGSIQVKYIWNSTPNIAPTVVTFTGGTAPVVSGSPVDTITLPAPTGTSVSGSGSFTPSVNPIVTMVTNIVSTCSTSWGPYAAFAINSGSSISLP